MYNYKCNKIHWVKEKKNIYNYILYILPLAGGACALHAEVPRPEIKPHHSSDNARFLTC